MPWFFVIKEFTPMADRNMDMVGVFVLAPIWPPLACFECLAHAASNLAVRYDILYPGFRASRAPCSEPLGKLVRIELGGIMREVSSTYDLTAAAWIVVTLAG
jgi:hypothetical protein